MTDPARCPWYIRWWHSYLRWVDCRGMRPRLSRHAWQFYRQAQEHWRCPCAKEKEE